MGGAKKLCIQKNPNKNTRIATTTKKSDQFGLSAKKMAGFAFYMNEWLQNFHSFLKKMR
jgi:hypothetical protein